MPILSLNERCDQLAQDLLASPMRIGTYHDLPFTILRYDPAEEYDLRPIQRTLTRKLEMQGREAYPISMADILWRSIDACEGHDDLFAYERQRDFASAQALVTNYLSDPQWECLLPDTVQGIMRDLDPQRHVVFLTRVAAMSPAIYHMSKLLEEMHGHTRVPTILFYPGTLEGTLGLRFMNIPDNEALGNYRVKIY